MVGGGDDQIEFKNHVLGKLNRLYINIVRCRVGVGVVGLKVIYQLFVLKVIFKHHWICST